MGVSGPVGGSFGSRPSFRFVPFHGWWLVLPHTCRALRRLSHWWVPTPAEVPTSSSPPGPGTSGRRSPLDPCRVPGSGDRGSRESKTPDPFRSENPR